LSLAERITEILSGLTHARRNRSSSLHPS
jgi:hypothetical protein